MDIGTATTALIGGINLSTAILNLLKAKGNDNQKSIVENAVKNASPNIDFLDEDRVDIGWLSEFIKLAEKVDQPDLQQMWGRIMAHEFENPGAMPRRIGRVLSEITIEDMKVFQRICSMRIGIVTDYADMDRPIAFERVFVPFSDTDEYSERMGVFYDDIIELEAMGIIDYSRDGRGFYISGVTYPNPLIYADGTTFLVLKHKDDELPAGHILLTKAGEALLDVIDDCKIQDNYSDIVWDYMSFCGAKLVEQTTYTVINNGRNDFAVVRKPREKR